MHSHLENEILFPIEKIVRFSHCKVCKENFIVRKNHILIGLNDIAKFSSSTEFLFW